MNYYQNALQIHNTLSKKEDMAQDYRNLGDIRALQGEKTKAALYYLMSIELLKQLGSTQEKTVQASLDKLK